MQHVVRILQATRLKGRATESELAVASGLAAADFAAVLQPLIDAGELDRAGSRLKLSAAGRSLLDGLLDAERNATDQELLRPRYQEFIQVNTEFKQLVTDWQLVEGVRPNDHTDVEYDARIAARLADLHRRFIPLLEELTRIAPRLAPYRQRLESAVAKVESGEHTWIARPLIDSYHTIWFELHEDLIGLAGLSRTGEAAAGRA